MKFRTRVLVVIFSLILVTGAVTTIMSQKISESIVKRQIYDHLETTAQSRARHIETFVRTEKETIKQLSEDTVIERLLLADRYDQDYVQKYSDATRRLVRTAKTVGYIHDLFILNRDGVIVASSEEADVGKEKSNNPYFLGAKEGASVKDAYVSSDKKRNTLAFSAPVYDEEHIILLGVVVARVSMGGVNRITTDRTGLGETGEIYLVNSDGYMITPSRFVDDTFLKQRVDTDNAKNRFREAEDFDSEEHEHGAVLRKNHLGKNVLRFHIHIPEMGWCLLAEIGEEEALAPVARLTRLMLMILSVLLVGGVVIAIVLSRTVTAPIVRLHHGAEEIMKGSLDYRVGTGAKDEIGQLSRAFDKMAISLKQSREELEEYSGSLEKGIRERTVELREQFKRSEEQRIATQNILEDLNKTNVDLESEITERKKTEEALKQSEQKYKFLIDNSSELIFMLNRRGKILFANRKTIDVSGYSEEEIIGQSVLKFLTKGSIAKALYSIGQEFLGHPQPTMEFMLKTKSGGIKYIETASGSTPIYEKGKMTGVLINGRDVTERKKAEKERASLENRISAIHDFSKQISTLLSVKDVLDLTLDMIERFLEYKHCAIHFVNTKTNELYNKVHRGYSNEFMDSFRIPLDGQKGITAWVAREGDPVIVPDVGQDPRYVSGIEGAKSEMAIPLKVGDEVIGVIDVESHQTNVFSEEDLTVLSTLASYVAVAVKNSLLFADLSKIKQELEELNLKLKDKVKERTQELKETQEKLIYSERLAAIGDLAENIAHELRHPLAILQNSAYFLELKMEGDDEKVRKHLAIMKKETLRADGIISALLSFSRKMESHFVPIKLNEVIERVLSKMIAPQGVEVVRDLGGVPTVFADGEQLQSIFVNLISNGIQAMPDGGILKIGTSREDGLVEVRISDTGVGIPKRNLARIFEPLFSTRSFGVGLGLCITKRLIENHGGTIEVQSKLNVGTTFVVRIPVERRKGR